MVQKPDEISFTVSSQDAEMRLMQFLKIKFGDTVSSRQIKGGIDRGGCHVNGTAERFSSYRVQEGDQITFNKCTFEKAPRISDIPILFEDEELIIINKPAGITSDAFLIAERLNRSEKPLFLVHRLDKETSGVLILAKTVRLQKQVERLFYKRKVEKTYRAIVVGVPNEISGTIESELVQKSVYQGQVIWGSGKKGLHAETEWRIKSKGHGLSLLKCVTKTGRMHQIRVHMSEMGYPILGDHQYARECKFPVHVKRFMLHAYTIVFTHPITKEQIKARAPFPKDFEETVHFLEQKES